MTSLTIRMNVIPEKRLELLQSITSLMGSIRKETGCRCCDFYQSVEDENEFFLLEEWETVEAISKHLQSDVFKVLLGAMILLKKPHEIRFYKNLSKVEAAYLAEDLLTL